MSTINTSNWAIVETAPPTKRTAAVQAAYDFFVGLPVGKSALIPAADAATAKNAARQLKTETDGSVEIRFRIEGASVRATKVKGAAAVVAEVAPATSMGEGASVEATS